MLFHKNLHGYIMAILAAMIKNIKNIDLHKATMSQDKSAQDAETKMGVLQAFEYKWAQRVTKLFNILDLYERKSGSLVHIKIIKLACGFDRLWMFLSSPNYVFRLSSPLFPISTAPNWVWLKWQVLINPLVLYRMFELNMNSVQNSSPVFILVGRYGDSHWWS